MALAWDGDDERVVIEAQAHRPSDDDEDGEPPLIDDDGRRARRCCGSGSPAPRPGRSSSARSAVVSAGRPPCPFCGGPLDPGGHVCPRANGYRR